METKLHFTPSINSLTIVSHIRKRCLKNMEYTVSKIKCFSWCNTQCNTKLIFRHVVEVFRRLDVKAPALAFLLLLSVGYIKCQTLFLYKGSDRSLYELTGASFHVLYIII